MKPRVLIAGCGDLGSKLAELLVKIGMDVYGLRRGDAALTSGVTAVRGDVTQPATLQALSAIKPQILVYCVAAGEQTDANYHAIYVDGLRNVLDQILPAQSLKHVFFVSSTRVYGQASDALLNEATPAQPADFGGKRLLEGEALLKNLPCPATTLRLSGIYGPGRTLMIRLAQQPQSWQPQNAWTNRIHRDDAARFIAFLVHRVLKNEAVEDCYIVTDNRPAPQWSVLMWLAGEMGVNLSVNAAPPVGGGKRLSNFRMRIDGFKLQYQDYRAGYASLLKKP